MYAGVQSLHPSPPCVGPPPAPLAPPTPPADKIKDQFQGQSAVEELLVALPPSLPMSERRVCSPLPTSSGDEDGARGIGGRWRECRGVGDCSPLGLALRNAESVACFPPIPTCYHCAQRTAFSAVQLRSECSKPMTYAHHSDDGRDVPYNRRANRRELLSTSNLRQIAETWRILNSGQLRVTVGWRGHYIEPFKR